MDRKLFVIVIALVSFLALATGCQKPPSDEILRAVAGQSGRVIADLDYGIFSGATTGKYLVCGDAIGDTSAMHNALIIVTVSSNLDGTVDSSAGDPLPGHCDLPNRDSQSKKAH